MNQGYPDMLHLHGFPLPFFSCRKQGLHPAGEKDKQWALPFFPHVNM